MFLEPAFKAQRSGWIEIICGSMFSGKTEELLRRINRATYAGLKIEVFKPVTDSRYHETDVVSHDDRSIRSNPVQKSMHILNIASDLDVVAIDEGQFFDEKLPHVCQQLALKGIRVIVAGLDMDYLGKPFGPMPDLMAVAEYITKVHAICVHCGNLASHSYRKHGQNTQVLLGSGDLYEPRCRKCFEMGNILDFKMKNKSSQPPPSMPKLFD
jgi:thymidine kinase